MNEQVEGARQGRTQEQHSEKGKGDWDQLPLNC